MTAHASIGYPVYSMLRDVTYKVYMGTAFVVKHKDKIYMITNWHVCNYFTQSQAKNEERKLAETVKIIKTFPEKDLCVMTTSRKDGLEIGKDVGVWASIYAAGYPNYSMDRLQLRSGHVIRIGDETVNYGPIECPSSFKKGAMIDPITKQTTTTCRNTQQIVDTNLEGTNGNSGSPVVNSKGQLVGIVHSQSDGKPNDGRHDTLNYVPVSELIKALDSL